MQPKDKQTHKDQTEDLDITYTVLCSLRYESTQVVEVARVV